MFTLSILQTKFDYCSIADLSLKISICFVMFAIVIMLIVDMIAIVCHIMINNDRTNNSVIQNDMRQPHQITIEFSSFPSIAFE